MGQTPTRTPPVLRKSNERFFYFTLLTFTIQTNFSLKRHILSGKDHHDEDGENLIQIGTLVQAGLIL